MDLNVIDLGLMDYAAAWKLQNDYAAEIAAGTRPPTLLLLEHPHVYTFGRKGNPANLLWEEAQLKKHGVDVYWVDRGGDITYHGPGQLVGYPLLPLGPQFTRQSADQPGKERDRIPQADYVGYVRKLEKTIIVALGQLGLAAAQRSGKTGVWIQPDVYSRCLRCRPEDRQKPAKIAAIGVKVDALGISRHGFALNVNPDMSYWNGIIACGLQDEPTASIEDLIDPVPSMEKVKQAITSSFTAVFGFEGVTFQDR